MSEPKTKRDYLKAAIEAINISLQTDKTEEQRNTLIELAKKYLTTAKEMK